ncbi:DHHC zinc finger domain containing protein [Tritrichomonas foetus]|uniref:Palmitoyltransferase n=1 Tax=Tritrichomonas foetus TaxID=1144522 RepID=A0A1J4JP23_9EUKA|nr:DHHC zinc finger domain containing protein [Tritrichomonas foetus]|eukprot:OHT00895.1 DHHC zinc finger domain containing protein [Tritrichomonas foetus]
MTLRDTRPLYARILYYSMIIIGPSLVFLSSGCVSGIVFYLIIYPFFSSENKIIVLIAILFTIIIFIPWAMANGSLIYSAIIDPGSTYFVLNSPQYRDSIYINSQLLEDLPKCGKCGLPKPPRAHHCSTCGRCHLKMDHHCAVIGKCVALRNQQPFMVACIWATLSTFIDVVLLGIGLLFNIVEKDEKLRVFIFALLTFVLFDLFYNFWKDSMNRIKINATTIELLFSNHYTNPFDMGEEENIFQVFGDDMFRFWLPHITDFCGFEWATKEYAGLLETTQFDGMHRHELLATSTPFI